MSDRGHAPDRCPLGQVIDRVADKWAVMVVGQLISHDRMRFNALQRAVPGVSQRMLTHTLRGLQRDGIVRRSVHPTVPPQVDYALTPLGRSLTGPLSALATWASENREAVERSRVAYDVEMARFTS